MSDYANLEMAIRKRDDVSYFIHFRFNGAGDEAEQASDPDPVVTLSPASIKDDDPAAYAAKLGAAIFTPEVAHVFALYRVQAGSALLRVRITIESSAPELHKLHWETLPDPAVPGACLFTGEQTIVSRFLTSGQDWRPVRLRRCNNLSALVVIANPKLSNLVAVDTARELEIAHLAMETPDPAGAAKAKINITEMAPGGPVSLNDLAAELQKGYDILYLVCHGALDREEPYLYLDDSPVPAKGLDLVQRIREMEHRPTLVVLASCQSAGKGGVGLSSLGPRLAEAGVPAVIAMQGSVFMDTASEFMKRFFSSLRRDGQIDRAVSVARGALRDCDDFWMPVLFLRLLHGCLWYEPHFEGTEASVFEQWKSICTWVRQGICVPVVGPDVAEHIFGNTRQLAQQLAQAADCPLDTRDQQDMAKVAQFLATRQDAVEYPRTAVAEAFGAQLVKSAERILCRPITDDDQTSDLLIEIMNRVAQNDKDPLKRDPIRIIASLNAKVFVNAANDELLETCLRMTPVPGSTNTFKQPIALNTNWRDETLDDKNAPPLITDAAKPSLYYVFGKRKQEEGHEPTWVLTEDDFFDYLIRTTRYQLMPLVVSNALMTGSLLFLGFPLDDWKFRVLFRLIYAKGGAALMKKYNHVAVQVDPGETTVANAQRARKYLEKYFGNSKIGIYWGSATDFLRDLSVQLEKMPKAARAG